MKAKYHFRQKYTNIICGHQIFTTKMLKEIFKHKEIITNRNLFSTVRNEEVVNTWINVRISFSLLL